MELHIPLRVCHSYLCRRVISISPKNSTTPSPLYKPHYSSPSSSPQEPIFLASYLQERHHFSPDIFSKWKLSSTFKYLENTEKCDEILSFFEEIGFSKAQLERTIKRAPQVLSAKLDRTIKPKIKILLELGLSPTDIPEIVSANPWILFISDCRIETSVFALESVLKCRVGLSRIMKGSGSGWLMRHDLNETMIPNIKFLQSCGIGSSQIVKIVYSYPRFFLLRPETMKEYVERVDEMGVSRESNMFIYAIRGISSMTVKNWEQKWELFRSLGFADQVLAAMFRKVPSVFGMSEKKIKEVMNVFIDIGKVDISLIAAQPQLLIYSVNRIKPRLQVLEVLERKKLLRNKPSVLTVCHISDMKFYDKFVLPYSDDVGEIYISS